MPNSYGIPESELEKIRARDKKCVYCGKQMIDPYDPKNHADSATIEHLSPIRPFYWHEGMKIDNIVICCGACNSSRSSMRILHWFKTGYCKNHNINEKTVARPVKEYLKSIYKN
jgi:5-methylcytosine-specific restriction endonuclease McrA